MATSESELRLDGKVALITGASRGIGAAIALGLASAGANIIVNYASSAEPANSLVTDIQEMGVEAVAIKADVSRVEEITKLFRESKRALRRIDIVINSAGIEYFAPVSEVTEATYDRVFALNSRAQFFVAQHALEYCEEGGKLLFMSSISARATGIKNHSVYTASKAAIEGFVRSFALEAGPRKITVNGIVPGGTKTDMFYENAWKYIPGGTNDTPPEVIEAETRKLTPLDRCGLPEDISNVVRFMFHPQAGWINGQMVTISGGATV